MDSNYKIYYLHIGTVILNIKNRVLHIYEKTLSVKLLQLKS